MFDIPQHLDREMRVHCLAMPVGQNRLRVDVAILENLIQAGGDVTAVTWHVPGFGYQLVFRGTKNNPAAIVPLTIKTTLVHEPVMVTTELHEIVEARLTAVSPVPDVVPVDEMLVCAAWKSAIFVSRLQRASHCGRNNPGFSADRQRLAFFIFG